MDPDFGGWFLVWLVLLAGALLACAMIGGSVVVIWLLRAAGAL